MEDSFYKDREVCGEIVFNDQKEKLVDLLK